MKRVWLALAALTAVAGCTSGHPPSGAAGHGSGTVTPSPSAPSAPTASPASPATQQLTADQLRLTLANDNLEAALYALTDAMRSASAVHFTAIPKTLSAAMSQLRVAVTAERTALYRTNPPACGLAGSDRAAVHADALHAQGLQAGLLSLATGEQARLTAVHRDAGDVVARLRALQSVAATLGHPPFITLAEQVDAGVAAAAALATATQDRLAKATARAAKAVLAARATVAQADLMMARKCPAG